MADQLAEIRKSVDGVAKAVASLAKAGGTGQPAGSTARTLVDVDALTDGEVRELALLVENERDLANFTNGRIASEGPSVDGMYDEFSRLGLLVRAAGGACLALSSTAHWAVEKRRQRKAEAADALKRQWRHERRVTIGAAFLGGAMGIAGTLLGVIVGHMM